MLAADAPWWKGEWGNQQHAQGDNRPAYQNGKATGANAGNWSGIPQMQHGGTMQDQGSGQYYALGQSNPYAAYSPQQGSSGYSAYAPSGKAQSKQEPSQGTPYGTGSNSGQQPSGLYMVPPGQPTPTSIPSDVPLPSDQPTVEGHPPGSGHWTSTPAGPDGIRPYSHFWMPDSQPAPAPAGSAWQGMPSMQMPAKNSPPPTSQSSGNQAPRYYPGAVTETSDFVPPWLRQPQEPATRAPSPYVDDVGDTSSSHQSTDWQAYRDANRRPDGGIQLPGGIAYPGAPAPGGLKDTSFRTSFGSGELLSPPVRTPQPTQGRNPQPADQTTDPRWQDVIFNPGSYDPQTVYQASQATGQIPIDPRTGKPMQVQSAQQQVDAMNAAQQQSRDLGAQSDAMIDRLARENGITDPRDLRELRMATAAPGIAAGTPAGQYGQAQLTSEQQRQNAINNLDWSQFGGYSRAMNDSIKSQQAQTERENAAMQQVNARMTAGPRTSAGPTRQFFSGDITPQAAAADMGDNGGRPYAAPQQAYTTPGQSFSSPGQGWSQQIGSDGMTPAGDPVFLGSGFDGNLANNPGANRPAPFSAVYQNFDGTVSNKPNLNQRDAFIQRLNDMTGDAIQSQRGGPVQYDFQSLWNQAGNMASNGWTNPLAGLFG